MNSKSDRMENSYKDIVSKKSDELNTQMRISSNLETKIYDLTKSLTEKQKEIENLSNINSSLQNNVLKISKEKGDLEFELNKKLEEELNGMIKSAIDSRDKLKNEYEKTIKELIEKYEKQIKFMKTVLAKQSEEFEEKIKTIEKEGGQKNKKLEKNEDDDEQPDAKMELMSDLCFI